MTEMPIGALVSHVQRIAAGADSTLDAELLRRFRRAGDAAAIELLIWRHAGMVHAVCRRVLGPSADADDAFQATFVALLKQARSIRNEQSFAGWLHRVAFRVSQRCRRSAELRRRCERRAARPEQSAAVDHSALDLGPILHAEIERLPAWLRQPFLLCHVQGRTNEEAARFLDLPKGTILSRLSRARARLRRQLLRRGVTLGAGGLSVADQAAAALVDSTVKTTLSAAAGGAIAGPVAALSQGVIRDMILAKIRWAAASAILAASILLSAGFVLVPGKSGRLLADQNPPQVLPGANKSAEPHTPPAASSKSGNQLDAVPSRDGAAPLDLLVPAKRVKKTGAVEDDRQLYGTWKVEEVVANGQPRDPGDMHVMFGPFGTMMMQDTITAKLGRQLTYKVDRSSNPPSIELTHDGKTQVGTYWLDGDNLKICMSEQGNKPPARFESQPGSGKVLFVLNRKWGSAETKWAASLFHKGLSHDFGKVGSMDAPPIYRFPIKNVFPHTVGIIGASFSSDWAKVKFPTPGSLAPGAESELEVIVDPGKLSGKQSMTINVSFEVEESAAGLHRGFTPGTAKGSIAGTRVKPEKMVSYAELTIHAEGASK